MTDVTMIGLGAMGSALARAFLRAGRTVTVWNRSSGRMAPVAALGAVAAESLTGALATSPVIVVCIDNYAATQALLAPAEAASALRGRTVVQLSTGTPREASAAGAWAEDLGAAYIDGAIMPYPDGIGDADAQILFAGPEPVYRSCASLLACLGGDLRYLGSNIAAAAVMDMALLTQQLCAYLGVLHGAQLCEAEGVDVDALASLMPPDDPATAMARKIHEAAYDSPGATMTVWNAALERILLSADDAAINRETPDLISSLFRRGIAAGHGKRDLATLTEVLRRDAPAG